MDPASLPIHHVSDELLRALRAGNRVVLSAPTGSGKSTQVPQIVMRSGLLKPPANQIVVLQPRRLAARLLGRRVAEEVGTSLGGLVGYQTRHDRAVSHETVVRFVTEGLFLRQMQAEPMIPRVGAVILDEFHERNLASDAVLALVRALQDTKRPDLKLIVMSATLEVEKVAAYLKCPRVEASGRTYPVELRYLARRSVAPIWDQAAEAVSETLTDEPEGDVLVFMPGVYEIRRTIEACNRRVPGDKPIATCALYSELSPAEQDLALRPNSRRKVIVSTNVAETSITIEGVRHVVDSGLARVNRYDARRGINVLKVEPISRASAEQRAGRAGRTAPGTCRRLWPEPEHVSRSAHDTPEVQRLDLAEVVLQLKSMGFADVKSFAWLDAPSPEAMDRAVKELDELGALAADGRLNALGETMAGLPMHPRFSRMLAEADRRRCLRRAIRWAALLSERDILQGRPKQEIASFTADEPRSDLIVLERAMDAAAKARYDIGRCSSLGVRVNACREVERTIRLFEEACDDAGMKVGGREERDDAAEVVKCMLVAFPDHVAVSRGDPGRTCAQVGRKRAVLDGDSVCFREGTPTPILAVDVQEIGGGARGGELRTVLSLASDVSPEWLRELFPDRWRVEFAVAWNEKSQAVEEIERHCFGELVLEETPRGHGSGGDVDPGQASVILAEQVVAGRLKLEQWDESVEQWLERSRCVAQWFPEKRLLAYEPDDLRIVVQEICAGATRWSQVKDRPCLQAVKDAMSWEDQQFVERMAPDRIQLPRGWRMKVEYRAGSPPRGKAKIQDFYGLEATPVVAAGRQRLVLEILGPNFRPLQTTDDLAGFWMNLYPTLKKELSRKYPRHEWR